MCTHCLCCSVVNFHHHLGALCTRFVSHGALLVISSLKILVSECVFVLTVDAWYGFRMWSSFIFMFQGFVFMRELILLCEGWPSMFRRPVEWGTNTFEKNVVADVQLDCKVV